jgi:hypothetical protein
MAPLPVQESTKGEAEAGHTPARTQLSNPAAERLD